MVAYLSCPSVWIRKGRHGALGSDAGPSLRSKEAALSRMRVFLVLCAETLNAEFPDFEIAQAMLCCRG
eukprot:11763143-Alexandrium_andersonii.AAC.1